MELATPRLILREFRQSDFDAVREYDCDPEVLRYERDYTPTESQTQAMLDRVLQDIVQTPRTHYRFAITLRPEDVNRGRISLTLNNASIREYEIGWTLHRRYWGQGYATEAAREVMDFAFIMLKAHRVVAFCHAENRPSARVMEKLGMQREGCIRETVWLNDAWHDELVYSILEQEFKR